MPWRTLRNRSPLNPFMMVWFCLPHATEAAGISGIPGIFAAIDKALKPGGFGVFISSVALDHSKRSDLDVSFLTSGRFDTFLEANTGWRLQGPLDLAITAATLDSVDSEDAAEPIIRLGERGRDS